MAQVGITLRFLTPPTNCSVKAASEAEKAKKEDPHARQNCPGKMLKLRGTLGNLGADTLGRTSALWTWRKIYKREFVGQEVEFSPAVPHGWTEPVRLDRKT